MTVSISTGANNVEESLRAGRIVRARRQQCYGNAFHVIQEVPGYEDEDYVEGLAVLDGGLLTEHGWVQRRDGQVIDPALPETPAIYIAGLRFMVSMAWPRRSSSRSPSARPKTCRSTGGWSGRAAAVRTWQEPGGRRWPLSVGWSVSTARRTERA